MAQALDPISAGIRHGIERAERAELPVRDVGGRYVGDIALAIVEDVLSRHRVLAEQAMLLAEVVTLNLAAGLRLENVESWLNSLCGDWGGLSG